MTVRWWKWLWAIAVLHQSAAFANDTRRAYTVDDLLNQGRVGLATVDASGRWYAWEQSGPYRNWQDFSLTSGNDSIMVVDGSARIPTAQSLIPAANGARFWVLQFSPSGRKLAYFRLLQGVVELGVVNVDTGAKTYFPVNARLFDWGPSNSGVLWVDNKTLLVAAQSVHTPKIAGQRRALGMRLWQDWNASWDGVRPTGLVATSQVDGGGGAPMSGELVALSVDTGEMSTVGSGAFDRIRWNADHSRILADRISSWPQPLPGPATPASGVAGQLRQPMAVTFREGMSNSSAWTLSADPHSRPSIEEPASVCNACAFLDRGEHVIAFSNRSGSALSFGVDDGETIIRLWRRKRSAELSRLNSYLREVAKPTWRIIKSSATVNNSSVTLDNCVLFPPGARNGQKYPLIVEVYPERSPNCMIPEQDADYLIGFEKGMRFWDLNLLASRGYIVLQVNTPPSLLRGGDNPIANMPRLAEAAADAVVATGLADARKIGLIGFSQGGYSSLFVATQSNRFSAVVSLNSWSDMYSHSFDAGYRELYFPDEVRFGAAATRYEVPGSNVFWIGKEPYAAPAAYVTNSPLALSDRITAPTLLVTSDMDEFSKEQYERLFASLYRNRKKAKLIMFPGEGHGPSSPPNIVQLWTSIFDWFENNLGQDGR